jgi:hypothetical protein
MSASEGPAILHEDNDAEEAAALLIQPGGGELSGYSLSEQLYVDSGNEKKVLYLLCIGLLNCDTNEPLFSFEKEPWSLLPKTSFLRPKNIDYVNEIARRASFFNIVPAPRPSNWTRVHILEWLERNPVCNNADIEFLTYEVSRLEGVLIRAQQQQELGGDSVRSGGGGGRSWRGSVPYLRMIMSLTQDNVKCLFLTRANARSRQELDARNSITR